MTRPTVAPTACPTTAALNPRTVPPIAEPTAAPAAARKIVAIWLSSGNSDQSAPGKAKTPTIRRRQGSDRLDATTPWPE